MMRSQSSLKVYSGRVEHNISLINERLSGEKLIVMMKANAYGHDLLQLSRFIDENFSNDNIDTIGVACLGEGVYLRKIAKIKKRIFIFSDFDFQSENSRDEILNLGLIPVLSRIEDIEEFLFDQRFKSFPLVIKFNSGMNRLGVDENKVEQLIELLKKSGRKELDHIMTHLGCSYLVNHEQNIKQLSSFTNTLNNLKNAGLEWNELSVANSGAIEQNLIDIKATHARPGLMLYGPQSTMTKDSLWKGKIISDFETKIEGTRVVKKGEAIGYGATRAKEDGGVLILPLGYGDGLLTGLQNFSFQYEGKKACFLGRVNMDLTTVWIDDSEPGKYLGKPFLIWNEKQDYVSSLVKHLGTHPYELFCSVSSRVPRQLLLK